MTDDLTRNPYPVDHLAEAALLGACMWSADAAAGAVEHLAPDMFDREAHRVVFEAIAALVAEGRTVDPVTVVLRLVDAGRLEHVGGAPDVHGLAALEACPTPSAWREYGRAVWLAADRRRQIREHLHALQDLGFDLVFDAPSDTEDPTVGPTPAPRTEAREARLADVRKLA